jgi:hypothetical protein
LKKAGGENEVKINRSPEDNPGCIVLLSTTQTEKKKTVKQLYIMKINKKIKINFKRRLRLCF